MRGRRGWVALVVALAAALVLALASLAPAGGGGPREGRGQGDGAEGTAGNDGREEGSFGAAAGPSGATRYESELALEDEAARVLGQRRERGDCVVARSGYLDLSGRTWGCVLQGSGWVEIVVVSEAADGAGSDVALWRMDADDAAALAGGG